MSIWESHLRHMKLEAAIKRAIYRSVRLKERMISARSIADRILKRSPNKALYSEQAVIELAGEILRRKWGA